MHRRTVLAALAATTALPGAAAAAQSFIETDDGQRLLYRDIGRGRPVLFIHGWTLSSEIWSGQTAFLEGQDLRAIAYDRRGHGQSSKPESGYDYERLASDLANVIDKLDLADLTLVSHSMAAGEVVRYFSRHGDRRVARVMLVAPTTPFPLKTADNPDGADPAVYDKVEAALQGDREAFFNAGTAAFLGTSPPAELRALARGIARQAALQAQIQCLHSFSRTDFRGEMSAVTRPALIVYGTADSPSVPVNARRTHAAIAGSRLEVYEGAPHALFLTEPERFNRDLLAFAKS